MPIKTDVYRALIWLEHLTVNQKVLGSSPRGGARKMIKPLYCYSVAVFDLYLSMSTRPNSFLSVTWTMS